MEETVQQVGIGGKIAEYLEEVLRIRIALIKFPEIGFGRLAVTVIPDEHAQHSENFRGFLIGNAVHDIVGMVETFPDDWSGGMGIFCGDGSSQGIAERIQFA